MKFQDGGVNTHDRARATEGYTLFAPVRHDQAYLINNDGHVVNQWQLGRGGINRCQLTERGNLLVNEGSEDGPPLYAGKAGYLREYDWDGNLVWEHHDQYHHHDGRPRLRGHQCARERNGPERCRGRLTERVRIVRGRRLGNDDREL